MKHIILISHGKLSEGMYNYVKMIIGDVANVAYYGLMPGEDNNEICLKVEEYIKLHGMENQYILVADLFGGSVSNSVAKLSEKDNVFIVNGMNMGLVIALVLEPKDMITKEDILHIIDESKTGICLTELLTDNIDESDII